MFVHHEPKSNGHKISIAQGPGSPAQTQCSALVFILDGSWSSYTTIKYPQMHTVYTQKQQSMQVQSNIRKVVSNGLIMYHIMVEKCTT